MAKTRSSSTRRRTAASVCSGSPSSSTTAAISRSRPPTPPCAFARATRARTPTSTSPKTWPVVTTPSRTVLSPTPRRRAGTGVAVGSGATVGAGPAVGSGTGVGSAVGVGAGVEVGTGPTNSGSAPDEQPASNTATNNPRNGRGPERWENMERSMVPAERRRLDAGSSHASAAQAPVPCTLCRAPNHSRRRCRIASPSGWPITTTSIDR